MSWFSPRSTRPRRAIKPRFSQRPGIRIAAVTTGACVLTAAVAGSMLQFSFAGSDDTGVPSAAASSPALADLTAAPTRSSPPPRTTAFHTCEEVREAGADPLRRGDPGYGPHLDRNGNGLACEPE